jgi:hypothetical protein
MDLWIPRPRGTYAGGKSRATRMTRRRVAIPCPAEKRIMASQGEPVQAGGRSRKEYARKVRVAAICRRMKVVRGVEGLKRSVKYPT